MTHVLGATFNGLHLDPDSDAQSSSDDDLDMPKRPLALPFYVYAIEYWASHALRYQQSPFQDTVLHFYSAFSELRSGPRRIDTVPRSVILTENSSLPDAERPAHEVASRGLDIILPSLVDHGYSVNDRDDDGRTPLSWAAENGHVSVVVYLLRKDEIDLDSESILGLAPIGYAYRNQHKVIVEMLLASQAKHNFDRLWWQHPLFSQDSSLTEVLLKYGVDINMRS
ncbi:MAG: hypothetical protein MMC23_000845 [Stictis urceolatum]|nr:hypothetical protein [Stictis urceolata]